MQPPHMVAPRHLPLQESLILHRKAARGQRSQHRIAQNHGTLELGQGWGGCRELGDPVQLSCFIGEVTERQSRAKAPKALIAVQCPFHRSLQGKERTRLPSRGGS